MGDGVSSDPGVPQARAPPRRALEYMLESERSLSNPHVAAFVSDIALLDKFRHDPNFSHWAKKSNFRKEVTEAQGALGQIIRCIPMDERIHGNVDSISPSTSSPDHGEGLVFVDLCAGRGMLSIVLANRFPKSKVLMVDADPKIKLPHLASLPTVTHHLLDILSDDMSELIHQAVKESKRATIIVGIHLCGDLSRRTIDLFKTSNAHALILSPCCLPRRRRHDVFGFHVVDQARKMKLNSHQLWCHALYGLLPSTDVKRFAVNMQIDDDVEGPFRTFLIARKRVEKNEVCAPCDEVTNCSVAGAFGKLDLEGKRGVVAGTKASHWRVVGPKV